MSENIVKRILAIFIHINYIRNI